MARPTAILLTFACLASAPAARGDDPPGLAAFRARLDAAIARGGEGSTVAVAFRDLETGRECLIRADVPFHPASTMKVPVMLEVYRQAGAGRLGLDDRLTIRNSFASLADGRPFALDPADDSERALYARVGQEATARELVRLMITESSNLATNLLIDRVSADSTTAFMAELGAGGIKVLRGVEDGRAFAKGLNNEATARGLMAILARLADRSAVSEGASAEMLGILRGQKSREGIPAGLPPGVPVAHKTGSIRSVYHDVGVVEPPGRRPFVLVVLTRGIAEEARAHEVVASVARLVHDYATRP